MNRKGRASENEKENKRDVERGEKHREGEMRETESETERGGKSTSPKQTARLARLTSLLSSSFSAKKQRNRAR